MGFHQFRDTNTVCHDLLLVILDLLAERRIFILKRGDPPPRFFSRAEMTAYLAGHFRYDTLRSWNRSTSYACNMKLYNLGLDRETTDKLWDIIQVPEFYDRLNERPAPEKKKSAWAA